MASVQEHLKKYHRSPNELGERSILPDLREDLIPSEEYEVDRILTHGWSPTENRIKYYIRWVGYGPEHDAWVSIPDLRNAKQLLKEYHERIGKSQAKTTKEAQDEYIRARKMEGVETGG